MANQIFILGVTFFGCRKVFGPFLMILGKSSSIYDTGNILFEKSQKVISLVYMYVVWTFPLRSGLLYGGVSSLGMHGASMTLEFSSETRR